MKNSELLAAKFFMAVFTALHRWMMDLNVWSCCDFCEEKYQELVFRLVIFTISLLFIQFLMLGCDDISFP